MNIGTLIKKRRKELNMTLEELGNLVGVGKSTVRKWENGMIENMGRDKIAALSKSLDISPLALLNMESDEQVYKSAGINYAYVPLYSALCCGNGGFVDDNIIEYIPVPTKGLRNPEECFCQIASGESMKDAGITTGDLLVFEKTQRVNIGVIGCFCIGENDAVCKKYKEQAGMIMLQPMNSEFEPIIIDPMNEAFRCIGILRKVIKDFGWEE